MITQKALEKLKPQSKPYFLRSAIIKGFAVKVNPSESIRYVVETKHNNKSLRKTIGSHPVMLLKEAEQETLESLKQIHNGYVGPKELKTAHGNHPVILAVQLMLYTGLRKNEALGLK